MQKTALIFLSTLLLCVQALAATPDIKIGKDSREINHITRQGYVCKIAIEESEVQKAWEKKLKEFGKVKSNREGEIWLTDGLIPSVSAEPLNLLSTVEVKNGEAEIFVACSEETENANAVDLSEALQQFLYEFGVELIRLDLQEQIAAADEAVHEAVKNHEHKVRDGSKLKEDIVDNEEERRQLEADLLENMRHHEQLKADIAKNKLEQEAALENIEALRSISEKKKEKLRTIQ